MRWWEATITVAAGIGVLEAARRILARWWRASSRLGRVVPHIPEFPDEIAAVKADVAAVHTEVVGLRTDLREHMQLEDRSLLTTEKVMATVIGRQNHLESTLDGVNNSLDTIRQILMNKIELGSGDEWLLAQRYSAAPRRPSAEPQ